MVNGCSPVFVARSVTSRNSSGELGRQLRAVRVGKLGLFTGDRLIDGVLHHQAAALFADAVPGARRSNGRIHAPACDRRSVRAPNQGKQIGMPPRIAVPSA